MQNVRRFVVKKGDEARQALLEGVYFGADAVRRTLGPYGRNAISGIRGGTPKITNDGVSILKELWYDKEIGYTGFRAAREAALELEQIGDGTTSAVVVTYAIILEATKRLGYTVTDPSTGKIEKGAMLGAPAPMALKRQIEAEAKIVIEELRKQAQPITTVEELIGSVRVSVEDEDIATMIGKLQWDIGPGGMIMVQDSNEATDEAVRIPGIRCDNGFPDSRVINNKEKQTLELADVPVIITDADINSLKDFRRPHRDENNAGILDAIGLKLQKDNKPVNMVIIARRFSQMAMLEIAQNAKNQWNIYPVNAPYVNQKEVLKDLSALLGGTFISTNTNMALSDITLSGVGFASKIEVSRWNAIFSRDEDEALKERVTTRIAELEKELEGEQSVFAQRMLKERMAQMTNGLGLIKVGALTKAEQKRKQDKIDDGVAAARSALAEGVVPGAGRSLMLAAEALPENAILREPMKAIYENIMGNAGEEFVIEEWVKDPLLVVRTVVEKAAEIAGNLITTEIAIDHEYPSKWAPPRNLEEFTPEELGPDATHPV